jgi:cytosine/adenosine deaminase-related metal-dependent hydrolase
VNSPGNPPTIRELRNVWLCRLHGEEVRPEFCNVMLADGKIQEIHPVDYRKYLHSGISAHPPSSTKPATTRPAQSSPVDGQPVDVIDAAARVATPPGVNFHEHFYSRLAKGLSLEGPMHDFRSILKNFWWRLDEALDADMVAACVRVGAAESLSSGVSYVFDHHSSPRYVVGSLSAMGELLTQFGMRAVLCLETSNRHSSRVTENCLDEQRRFILQDIGPDLRGLVGLHAPFTLNDQTLSRAAALCSELSTGVHIHLAEDGYEQRFSRDTHDCPPAVRLERCGLLEHPGILAHGVHLEKEDWRAISRGQCALALNPDSNLNNAVGLGRYGDIPDSVVLLAGTDGMHANPNRSIKQLFLLHRHQGGEMAESFRFIRRLYFDQLRFVKTFFPDYPGLNPGERADLVVWDYKPPSPFSADTFWGHLVYGILEAPAWTVCMRGKALLAAGGRSSPDVAAVARSAAIQGARLFKKLGVGDHG